VETGSVQYIYASHVLEHLRDFRTFFREAYRVMRPDDSEMGLRVPYGGHASAWWDVTHMRPWYPASFCFLQPGYDDCSYNPQHGHWDAPYQILRAELRLNPRLAPLLRWRLARRLCAPWFEHWPGAVEELWVSLKPLKTPLSVRLCRQKTPANAVPMGFFLYRHQLEGRTAPRPGEVPERVEIAAGRSLNGYV
jgi:hypothetical protein